jgi:hypothetical protein
MLHEFPNGDSLVHTVLACANGTHLFSCKQGNEPLCFITDGEFLDCLSSCYLLKDCSLVSVT